MFVEIHMLQNFAPSNLNRDDTNSPKDCTFGGTRRARISSQCLKRAIRTNGGFQDAVDGRVGKRTKLVHQAIIDALAEKGRDRDEAASRVQKALEAVQFKWDEEKGRTSVLLFVSPDELKAWANVIDAHWDNLAGGADASEASEEPDKGKKKTAKQAKKDKAKGIPAETTKALKDVMKSTTTHAVDIALFGRMVAENTDMNVDASCQVAHAISTHSVAMEMDFYTAVDDLQPKEDTGAGMMGIVEFNSACFYRYALVDVGSLYKNVGRDQALTADAIVAFTEAAANAIPSGKQNSFAAQNRPDWIRVDVHRGSPHSLVNAFAKAVRPGPNGDLIDASIQEATRYAAALGEMYGDDASTYRATASTKSVEGKVPFKDLLEGLRKAIAGATL